MKPTVVIIQPTIPSYRVDFFKRLSEVYALSIYCSPICNNGVKCVELENINVVKMPILYLSRFFFWQPFVFKILRQLINTKGQLVINGNPRFLSSMILAIICKLIGIRVIWWGQGLSSTSTRVGFNIRSKLMSFFDVVLYYDNEIDLFPKHRRKISALNNGLDIDAIRRNFDLKQRNYEGSFNIFFIGRYTEKSNLRSLFEVINNFEEDKKRNIKIVLISDLSNTQNEEFKKTYPSVIFDSYFNITNEEEITNIAKNCHIFCYPGSVGLSLIHAFALGIPAVIHDDPKNHMPEFCIFKDKVNGISYKYGDLESFKDAIELLFDNRAMLQQLSVCAFDTVGESYSTKGMSNRMVEMINDE